MTFELLIKLKNEFGIKYVLTRLCWDAAHRARINKKSDLIVNYWIKQTYKWVD
jgi:hypothetical protein